MQLRGIIVALSLCALTPLPGNPQQPEAERAPGARPEVLVLGTWHMANTTGEADDILSSQRQAEIADVMAVLTRFRPTKIALEAAFYRSDSMAELYADYVEGEHELTRNERQQLGFRLARELGHTTVYSVDADGDFPLPRLQDYVEARGHAEEYEAMRSEFNEWLAAEDEYRASHTLLEALLRMNSDEYAAEIMAHDYDLAHFGEPWNWAGPDLLSDWFRRNIRIYGNVVDLIESPDERVLVIFGAGHLGWLRHDFASNPKIRLRKLSEFAR